MGVSIEVHRARVGSWSARHLPTANRGSINNRELFSSPWFTLLVLAALLMIGGIELNPGPTQVNTALDAHINTIIENLVQTMATYWLILELKEKNSILDKGLNLGLQIYVLVLQPLSYPGQVPIHDRILLL